MRAEAISNQNIQGKVVGCSRFKPKQRKVFQQVRPCLENLIKNKDFDLRIYFAYGGELRVSAGDNPVYAVINSNHPDIWINRSKEIISNFEQKRM